MAIQHRRGTAAAATAANVVLAAGQLGVETDTGRIKVGDGVLAWNSLPYSGPVLSQVTVFTADGTFTPPVGAVSYEIICVGPGQGGGSGRRGAAATVRTAGSGGGSGALSRLTVPSSAVTGATTVLVPAAGTGGAAVTVNDTNGNPSSGTRDAVSTAFGDLVKASCGGPGLGGTTGSVAGGGSGQYGVDQGAAGGAGSATGQLGAAGGGSLGSASGGGAGGGITSADVASAGGAGGLVFTTYSLSPAALYASGVGGAVSTAGTAGVNTPASSGLPGGGGGGGGSSVTAAAGAGGNAARYGGGGGGGGASLNGFASGAGGNGGPGICIVITHF